MTKFENATNLDELLAALRAAEAAARVLAESTGSEPVEIDIDNLPVFGGETPANTAGVWSWDETRLLVGACIGTGEFSDDLRIVARR